MGVCMHIDGVECDNCRGQRYGGPQQFHFYYPPHVLDQILEALKEIKQELHNIHDTLDVRTR